MPHVLSSCGSFGHHFNPRHREWSLKRFKAILTSPSKHSLRPRLLSFALPAAGITAAGTATICLASTSSTSGNTSGWLGEFWQPWRRATDTILILCILGFGLQKLTGDLVTVWGAKITPAIMSGQIWRLVTPAFLHSGWAHLLVNLFSLSQVGPHMELLAGRDRFLALFFISTVSGTLFSVCLAPTAASVGVSCALFGICGGMALYYWRHRDVLRQRSKLVLDALGRTALLNVAIALMFARLDHWGHIGGLLGGVAAVWFLGPNWVPAQEVTLEVVEPKAPATESKGTANVPAPVFVKYVDKPPFHFLADPHPRLLDKGLVLRAT